MKPLDVTHNNSFGLTDKNVKNLRTCDDLKVVYTNIKHLDKESTRVVDVIYDDKDTTYNFKIRRDDLVEYNGHYKVKDDHFINMLLFSIYGIINSHVDNMTNHGYDYKEILQAVYAIDYGYDFFNPQARDNNASKGDYNQT